LFLLRLSLPLFLVCLHNSIDSTTDSHIFHVVINFQEEHNKFYRLLDEIGTKFIMHKEYFCTHTFVDVMIDIKIYGSVDIKT